ncbi:MAG: hypothetical protein AAFV53_27065 [Myxococcota bacterium]
MHPLHPTLLSDAGEDIFGVCTAGGVLLMDDCSHSGLVVERHGTRLRLADVFRGQLPDEDGLFDHRLSADGALLVAWSAGGDTGRHWVAVVDAASGETLHLVSIVATGVHCVAAVSHRHQTLMVIGDDEVCWWDLRNISVEPVFREPARTCDERLWTHPSGRFLLGNAGIHGWIAFDLVARRTWGFLPGSKTIQQIGFGENGRHLLTIATQSRDAPEPAVVRRLDLGTGQWLPAPIPLALPPGVSPEHHPLMIAYRSCFSPDGRWLASTVSRAAGWSAAIWDTRTGDVAALFPLPEPGEYAPVVLFAESYLFIHGERLERVALEKTPFVSTIVTSEPPTSLRSHQMLLPNHPRQRPVSPKVIAQVARLGGVWPAGADGRWTLDDYLAVGWPQKRTYHGKIHDHDLWMVELMDAGPLSEEAVVSRFLPFICVGIMDGGNYALLINLEGHVREPGDPLVFLFDHHDADDVRGPRQLAPLSEVLAILKAERTP